MIKMTKRLIAFLLLTLWIEYIYAQPTDSLYQIQQQRIETLERENRALKSDVQRMNRQLNGLQTQINNLSADVSRKIEGQQSAINGISDEVNANTESLATTSAALNEQIAQSNEKTDGVAQSLRKNTLVGVAVALALLIVTALLYSLLRKRINKDNSTIKEIDRAQKRLQEESIKLDSKMMELLEGQLKMHDVTPKTEKASAPDHSLVVAVANEVARIEQNLNNMDASVRGVSNLKNRAAAIIASLNSKGYEIPKLLGEPFHDGYNMDAEMELDESLPVGTQIIKRVIKPQINYEGKMIQAAKVVVAFNE